MNVRQQIIPMAEFARAMLKSHEGFAERVAKFEQAFGAVDADTLGVMAQASYFCWFEVEYERDYIDVCRAIGTGKATSLYLCCQVTPQRWLEMNTYIVGVQRWLGVEHALPCQLPAPELKRIDTWLGDHSQAKDALAELFVCHLAAHLRSLSLAKLSGPSDPDDELFADLTLWYSRHDGTEYSSENLASIIEGLKQIALREMDSAVDAEELIAGILEESQPACHHRFSRYLDVKITSIGALKWRGAVPPDVRVPKYEARNWFENEANLKGWLNDAPADTDLLKSLHEALGTPTERKKAIVRDFFCGPPDSGFFDWLTGKAQTDGTTAEALFKNDAQPDAPADVDKPRR